MTQSISKEAIRAAYDHRMAVRVYNDEDISRDDMDFILDTAWLSPSSVGLEGWRFVVLDRRHIEQLRDSLKPISWGAGPQLDTASHFVLLLAEKNARYDSQVIKESLVRRGISEEDIPARLGLYKDFQERDQKIADNPRALWDWTAKQTYIAMGNMMTTAAMIGIDTCPIEGFDYDKVNAVLSEAQIIDPEKEGIASMVSFGYRLKDPKHPRSRKPRQEVITWLD
ncbi:NAD(P)H-dependent oxidoreductase [Streptococcus saliviloxodontae]|uniref:Nitroreductase n=1 Tax=Streptococcus saliviloxodontae TaxID=1349416 RepID=A0ABS2PJP7_9STRE|nr:NAD(P)H-dependent oxidoreductase [Streptococcus saliviloxodontae]MBM7635655.1 nitroreductase [Streptococcus saliviloxodontae]